MRLIFDLETPPLVLVDWIDSYMAHGWEDKKERLNRDRKPGICRSVGFLVEDTEDWLTLSESMSASDNVGCTTTIPRLAVLRKVTLKEG